MKNYRNTGRLSAVIALWFYGVLTSMDWFPVLLTLPTFFLILINIYRIESKNFTVADMLWLCCLLFFVVAPCQNIVNLQFDKGPAAWVRYSLSNFLVASGIIFVSFLIFSLTAGKALNVELLKNYRGDSLLRKEIVIVFLISITSFFFYVFFSGGLLNVLSARAEKNRDEISFLSTVFLAMMAVGAMIVAMYRNHQIVNRSNSRGFATMLFVGVISVLIVSVNPLNSSRFFNLATWLPVFLAACGGRVKYKYVYLLILLGVFVLMPVMSISTRGGVEALSGFNDSAYGKDFFLLKDMDVFDTLVHTVYFMEDRAFYFGQNTITFLLFFVPRAIWLNKPIVGGLIIGDDLYTGFYAGTDNLSLFPGGDLYMDFWFPGVVVGAIISGLFCKWLFKSPMLRVGPFALGGLVAIGSLPILLRGPLGAVAGYFLCLILATFFYRNVLRLRR